MSLKLRNFFFRLNPFDEYAFFKKNGEASNVLPTQNQDPITVIICLCQWISCRVFWLVLSFCRNAFFFSRILYLCALSIKRLSPVQSYLFCVFIHASNITRHRILVKSFIYNIVLWLLICFLLRCIDFF